MRKGSDVAKWLMTEAAMIKKDAERAAAEADDGRDDSTADIDRDTGHA